MEEPVATPKLPPPLFRAGATPAIEKPQFSSSPGFGTPAYPIQPRQGPPVRHPFAPQTTHTTSAASSVLPILLPPQTLRPVAFRTLTKKHNLTLTSSGLGLLSTFIGRFCGSGWREESLAERVLDEVAKAWKAQNGGILIEDGPEKKLTAILKYLEPCMSAGRIDTAKLSRTNSVISNGLSRTNTLDIRPGVSRDDSQQSLGISGLDVEDAFDVDEVEGRHHDARPFLKVISAFKQPRLAYSITKKTLETVSGDSSLLPSIPHKIAMSRNRYNIIHQRLLRNESFQTPSFAISRAPSLQRSGSSSVAMSQAYKITPISNLLGRSGTAHLLLGLLSLSPTSDLCLTDLSGSIVLDTTWSRCIPHDGAWFCPGMIVLVEGTYEEDGSNNSSLGGAGGVGGQIKGRFVADTFAGPLPEKREVTLGISQDIRSDHIQTSVGAGFGWVDFLGVGSEKAVGQQQRRLQRRLLGSRHEENKISRRTKVVIIGECHLDSPRVLEAVRAIFSSYLSTSDEANKPLTVVLMGNFVSAASMAGSTKGGGSVDYKEHFDALASTLSEFPQLLASTTFVFIPGDNDPWASSFSSGAATCLPRQGIPELFTSRIRRAFAQANNELGRKEGDLPGEAIWASNPARVSLFGPVEEIVLFRDDISGRLRRNSITFKSPEAEEGVEQNPNDTEQVQQEKDTMDLDQPLEESANHIPQSKAKTSNTVDLAAARKLVKTLLDQSHLSPFPLSTRPVLWDYASSLSLYPLPTALVLCDSETPGFCLTYEGCHVMNPGRVLDEWGKRKGVAKWVEYDVKMRKGVQREVRF